VGIGNYVARTPQVGMAEAAGSQAVCAETVDAKRRAREERMVEDFIVEFVGLLNCVEMWLCFESV
jgi:hypothetical protein